MGLDEELRHMLAHQFRTAREALGLSQEAVAERIGSTQSEISKIESGDRGVPLVRAIQLATLYGTSVVEIIERIAQSQGLTAPERRELRKGFFGEE
jgi:transcriptional regulator with XRE-family HTH domain